MASLRQSVTALRILRSSGVDATARRPKIEGSQWFAVARISLLIGGIPIDNIRNVSKNTSITLGRHFERFVSLQVKSGRFGTTSEVIRAALRLLEEDEAKLAALRSALTEGQQGGLVEDFNIEDVIAEAREHRD
ncbi:MAG: type II toxin-antitoxin system ParD family antitoxin [Myxococcaceae bacterium]